MFNKAFILVIACFMSTCAIAFDNKLALPPSMAAEAFDRPMVQPAGDITFQQALVLTLKHSPELATYAWTIRSREIDLLEAGLLPNPQAEIGLENFAGYGDAGTFKSAETTIVLSQVIELGDKRMRRQQLAATNRDLARWDYEVKRMDLLSRTAVAFADVLVKQEKLTIAHEINQLADEIYKTVKKRVEAGKVSPLDGVKARVELSRTRLSQLNAERNLAITKQHLISSWGGTEVTFNRVLGDLYNIHLLPDLSSIVNKLNNSPDIARWATEMNRYQNAINLAQADTIPDISVSAGLRHLNESNDVTAVASISIPLFFFNNKQTGVQRSNIELSRASKEQAVNKSHLRSSLLIAYHRLNILYKEVTTLKNEILPGAEEVFIASRKVYRLGKLDLLNLLDAQRTYFEARVQYVNALADYHRIVVAIERLTGSSISERSKYIVEEAIR